MNTADPELLRTFERLGIKPEEATVLKPHERSRRAFHELDDDEVLHWLRLLGPDTPATLVAEVRRRRLIDESELNLWLGSGTDAA